MMVSNHQSGVYPVNVNIGKDIIKLRKDANLTQKELAEKIGTSPSVISRLENANYKGHSLSMLIRIASAFDKKVEIDFVPK